MEMSVLPREAIGSHESSHPITKGRYHTLQLSSCMPWLLHAQEEEACRSGSSHRLIRQCIPMRIFILKLYPFYTLWGIAFSGVFKYSHSQEYSLISLTTGNFTRVTSKVSKFARWMCKGEQIWRSMRIKLLSVYSMTMIWPTRL